MIHNIKKFSIGFLGLVFIICASLIIPHSPSDRVSESDRVSKILETLGSDEINKFPDVSVFGVSAKRGEEIIRNGFSAKPGGGKSKKQSKHFVCTSCHNLEKEDPDLRFADPQARLDYTTANGLPFLQGTTLYGAVNRDKYYNGDYFLKYGDLVLPARKDIREAIQLCAVECAQGRKLKDWELESILSFLWTLDLKLSDLNLNDDDLAFIDQAVNNRVEQDSAIALIKSRYLNHSPAHFGSSEESKANAANLQGDPENGAKIYDNSCLHCHEGQRHSYFLLVDTKVSFNYLKRKEDAHTDHSVYQVTRYGVKSIAGRKSYMPQYPLEKMSEQQLQDLRAYIHARANG